MNKKTTGTQFNYELGRCFFAFLMQSMWCFVVIAENLRVGSITRYNIIMLKLFLN